MLLTDGAGFIEGTLVHAREGLKPVEEIRVGDYVLSKPEDGKGEQAYKRVVRTMPFEDKEVWCVDILPKFEKEQAKLEGRHVDNDTTFYFAVTQNHPFWVNGLGWIRADKLHFRYREDDPGFYPVEVEFVNGELGLAVATTDFQKTENQDIDIAWLPIMGGDVAGNLVNLGKNRKSVEHREIEIVRLENSGALDEPFRCTVYNLEVEEFHTYYVGTNGVWVHNTNYARSSRGEFSTNSARAIPSLILLRKEKKCC